MKIYLIAAVEGFRIFRLRKVNLWAAASSFYIVLGFIPFLLLVIRALGFALGDISDTEKKLFEVFRGLYPEINAQFLIKIQKIVKGTLYATPKVTFLNLAFLVIASLSFTSSIWNGLAFLTQDRTKSLWVRFKGLLIIMGTLIFLIFILIIPPFLKFVLSIAKDSFIVSLIKENFPDLINFFNYAAGFAVGLKFLFQNSLVLFLLSILYFTFLYGYFFHWKLKPKEALFAAFIFVSALTLGKYGFYIYFKIFRKNLESNYGDYYSIFVSLLWIIFVMVFFFYGACICYILEKLNKHHGDISQSGHY